MLHWWYKYDNKLRVSKRRSEIQEGGFESSVAQILAAHMITTKFQRLYTLMFLGSGNTDELLGIVLRYVWVCRKSMMAAINQK